MSDTPTGPGSWLASDGKYYPPEQHPDFVPPPPPQPTLASATPPPYGGGPLGPLNPDVNTNPPPEGKKRKSGWVVGGVLAALVVLALVAAAVVSGDPANSDGDGEVAGESEQSSPTADEPASTTAAPTSAAPTTVDEAPAVSVVEVGMSAGNGYDNSPRANAGAVLTNEGDSAAVFFEVVFTFKDQAGAPVGTESSYVYVIEPGGKAYASVDSSALQGPASTVEAVAIVEDSFISFTGVAIPITVGQVGPGSFGSLQVSGTATNPTNEPISSGAVQCVLRRGGAVVGGVSTILDTMVPGAEIAWDATVLSEWVVADSAECSAGEYT